VALLTDSETPVRFRYLSRKLRLSFTSISPKP
jgi:hypothetical protein